MSVNPSPILIYTTVSAAPIAWLLSKAVPRVFLEKCNLGRTNFEGKQVPTACGVVLLVAVLPTLACAVVSHPHRPEAVLFAFAAPAFALLGLVDDIWGDRSAGGFKGHLKSLLAGKITTGIIKALFGGAAALGCGFALAFRKGALSSTHGLIERQSLLQNSVEAVLTTALIALCANGLNLLDTRPSRAGSIYMLFSVILLVWSREPPAVAVSSALLLAVVAYLPAERRRECMMGDTGANMLGAVLGLHAALILEMWQKAVALAALVWLHLYSENHSLSAAIEGRPILNRLDKALRGEK